MSSELKHRSRFQEAIGQGDLRVDRCWASLLLGVMLVLGEPHVSAQGILSVSPNRTAGTAAGSGVSGYAGENGPADTASLALPSATAYDNAGNLFIADTNNHIIREVTTAGIISTVAGTPGVAGFGGDGRAATTAYLDTPTGVAVDANGNVYVADSHNARVRKIADGVITTVAGTGVIGFAGDGGAAASAQLALPSAVALDASGSLYIADTNNHRVRKVSGTVISTIAGNGEQLFAGDGGVATASSLNLPTGLAVDASGNVYIADRNNHRVRVVSAATGIITTVAGSGAASFAGGFSGDGANSNAANLSKPSGVSIDGTGNIYVADTNNQRVRQVSGSSIATIFGTGEQGFGGDGGVAATALLNAPRSAASDPSGNLTIADTLDHRVRSASLGRLSFSAQTMGTATAAQAVQVSNTGSAAFTVSTAAISGPFLLAGGGTCPAVPFALAPGASCTQNLAFQPIAVGASGGLVSFGGTGVVTQSVLLAGTLPATQGVDSIAVTSLRLAYGNAYATLAASVAYTGAAAPTGALNFSVDGGAAVRAPCAGTSTPLMCSVNYPVSTLAVGSHTLKATEGTVSGQGTLILYQPAPVIPAPVCSLGVVQGASATSNLVSVAASCTSQQPGALGTAIAWGDGHTEQVANSGTLTHLYSSLSVPMLYSVVLTGTDSTNQSSSVTQAVNVLPTSSVQAGRNSSVMGMANPQPVSVGTLTVQFLCSSVRTAVNGADTSNILPSSYGIACSSVPITAPVGQGAAVTVSISTSASTATFRRTEPGVGPAVLLAAAVPFSALLLLGLGSRQRRRRLLAGATLLVYTLGVTSCGGHFTAPAPLTTPSGLYYLTVTEVVVNSATPTNFIQTSLIVPLQVSR